MRINQENKSLDMEIRDINFILPPYVRSYQFYCKGEAPEKIVFPMFPSVDIVGEDREIHPMPIEWVSPESPVAKEIAKDGAEISEVTPEQEAELDEKDKEIATLKKQIADLITPSTRTLKEDESALTPAPEDILRQQEEDALAEQEAAMTTEAEAEVKAAAEHAESPARAAFAEVEPTAEEKAKIEASQPVRQPKQPPGGDIGPGQPPSDMGARDSRDQVRTARDLIEEPEIEGAEEKPYEKEIKRDDQGNPIIEDKPDAPD